jgi:diadenosine tetraphosphatase ApaH/serine/threonine PP2A family protein phosphatase
MKPLCGIIQSILKTCTNGTPGSSQFATSGQVQSVLDQALDVLLSEPPLLNLSGQFTVVGDIHGNILSLVRIFQELGWPDSRRYLFLGDYVDRGDASCEVVVLLYCLKILFPQNIFLLRGNHEFESMTREYGFRAECASRFLMSVYSAFMNSFTALPIAAIINNTIFCAHGGIAPDLATNLEGLRKISGTSGCFEEAILWSDPCEDVEGFQPSPRGRGFRFGNDEFENFLSASELTMMIRAHENCRNGFDWPFGTEGKLLTVFSSVDYCRRGNDGAVAIVTADTVKIDRFAIKSSYRSRLLIPSFVIDAISMSLSGWDLLRQDSVALCIEIF